MKWVTNNYQYGVYLVLCTILICIEQHYHTTLHINLQGNHEKKLYIVIKIFKTNEMSFWCLQVMSINNINGVTAESIREHYLGI